MYRLFALNDRYWPYLAALVLAAITALSLMPLPELPLPEVDASDKLHHLLAYAALALPVALARPRALALILLGFVAWSGAVELVQPHVNRYGEWIDLAANVAGLAIGTAAATLLRRHVRTG